MEQPPSSNLSPAPKPPDALAFKLEDLMEELAVLVSYPSHALVSPQGSTDRSNRPSCLLKVVALRETLTKLDLSQNNIMALGVLSRAIAHSGVEMLFLHGNPLTAPAV
jgi:hypothetical protein